MPDRFVVRRIFKPTCKQIEASIRVLMEAFADDRFVATVLGGKQTDQDIYYRYLEARVLDTVGNGELWVAEDSSSIEAHGVEQDTDEKSEVATIVGVALWCPPGSDCMGNGEHRVETGLDAVMDGLGDDLRNWWYDYLKPRIVQQASGALGGPTGRRDSCHLQVLTVLPSAHNRGIGRSLLLARAKQAWEQDQRVYWSTSSELNVTKYSGWGGRVLNKERYEGDADGRSFDLWIMDLPKSEVEDDSEAALASGWLA